MNSNYPVGMWLCFHCREFTWHTFNRDCLRCHCAPSLGADKPVTSEAGAQ